MLRRALIVLVAVFGSGTAGLVAQNDAFLGIWELNLAKSSLTRRGGPPKIETIVNVAEPSGFRSTLAIVNEKSTTLEIHHFVFDGAFHLTEGGDPRELSVKRIDQNTIEQDTRRNGEITVKRHLAVSKDGKTLTVIASGTMGSGFKYTDDTRVYDRK